MTAHSSLSQNAHHSESKTQRGTAPVILLVGIAAAAIVGFFLFSNASKNKTLSEQQSTTTTQKSEPAKVEEEAVGSFEFLDATTFAKLSTLPFGKKVHVVVASSGTPDVRKLRPITIQMLVDGEIVWEGTLEDLPTTNGVTLNCRGANGCSMDGPEIKPEWKGKKIEFTARDKDGKLIASHTEL